LRRLIRQECAEQTSNLMASTVDRSAVLGSGRRCVRRIGIILFAVGCAALATDPARATHGGQHTPCGDHSSHPAEDDLTVYQTTNGAGVIGGPGYAEIGSGEVHGATADGSLYGHVGTDGACAGSTSVGLHRDIPL
jgi:hypothetical protein